MLNLIVSLDPPETGNSSTQRLPLTWHKLRRKMIKKLAAVMKTIRSQDVKTDLQNASLGVNTPMFIGRYGSGIDTAMKTLQNACSAALSARG